MNSRRHRVKLAAVEYTTLIDTHALAARIGAGGIAVVDCRFDLARAAAGREAYLAAHVSGARYAALDRDLSAAPSAGTGRHPLPPPERFARRLGELGIGNDTQVVAYDQSNGAFAARLWWMLRWLGHRRAAVLDGGYAAWASGGGALQAGEPPAAARRVFVPHVESEAVVSTTQLLEALRDARRVLIDARAAERYRGVVEPLDRVAGHVPGARNYPYALNLDADGRFFLPPAELRRRWLDFLGGAAAAQTIAMCGSGVSACHNLLALEAAGLAGAKLYAGSFSEWIADPGRKVATGSRP